MPKPIDAPKVIFQNRTAFGANTESVAVQSNRPDPRQEASEQFLYRLALPARFEAMLADAVVWVSSPAFIASILGHALANGVLSVSVMALGVSIVCLPVLLWGLYLRTNCDGFEAITGVRVVMILAGLMLGSLPFLVTVG